MDLNKVSLIGRLTKDPEIKTIPSGTNVVSFSVATSFKYKETNTTEFHNIVAWSKLADIISQYCKKGQQVYLEGRLQTRSWEDKDSGKKVYKTEIVANNFIMLGSKGKGNGTSSEPIKPEITGNEETINLDSIPF